MYSSLDKKSFAESTVKKILSSNVIYLIAAIMLLISFTVFSICIENVSKLIVGTANFNLWNLIYIIIEFLLGVGIIADSITMIMIRSNAKIRLEKSVNYLELVNIFTVLDLIFGIFFFVVNGIKVILENIYLYNYAKDKGVTSSQEEYMELIIFDIFILCIILAILILAAVKLVQFIRGIEKLYIEKELSEEGVIYLKVILSIMSAVSVGIAFFVLPILGESSDYSDIEILSYFTITVSISAIIILAAAFIFGVSGIYRDYKFETDIQNEDFNKVPVNFGDTKFCRQCGNICRAEARFCANCGFQLTE